MKKHHHPLPKLLFLLSLSLPFCVTVPSSAATTDSDDSEVVCRDSCDLCYRCPDDDMRNLTANQICNNFTTNQIGSSVSIVTTTEFSDNTDGDNEEESENDRDSRSASIDESDVIFQSLNRSEKLHDYCLCRHISTLDCTSMEDLDDCTTLCNETEGGDSDSRPFCNKYGCFEEGIKCFEEGIKESFCQDLCMNFTRPCRDGGEYLSLASPEASGCVDLCLFNLTRRMASLPAVCRTSIVTTCREVLDRTLYDAKRRQRPFPPNITMLYFRIQRQILLRGLNTTSNVDLFHRFFSIVEELNMDVPILQNRIVIRFIADIVNDLVTRERRDTYERFNGEDFQESRFSSQENLLIAIEETLELITRQLLQSNESFVCEQRTNFVLYVEKTDLRRSSRTGNYEFIGSMPCLNDIFGREVELVVPLSQLKCEDEEEDCDTAISIAVVKNLARYMDRVSQANSANQSMNIMSAANLSVVNIYTREGDERNAPVELKMFEEGDPLTLTFPAMVNESRFECVSWNFTRRNWSSDGIMSELDSISNRVICDISHLTSFSILVSPTGLQSTLPLNVVSYIGCAISIVCLILTILALLVFRKALNKGVLLYIHLNLAIALLISLVLFVATVEPARNPHVLCVVTTAFLHYFLLCSFCWMLVEGIILYILVVKVFGKAADRWYWLLILGWGLPVPIVTISAAVLEVQGSAYTAGTYCWLNATTGAAAIWTFIVPMLIIIMINTVILIATVFSLIRVRKLGGAEFNVKKTELVKSALKSMVILLPLMGVTWVIGLFAIDQNTTVFAWVFTILNSLQGAAIFILHVLKNDAIQKRLKNCMICRCCRDWKKKRSNSMAHSLTNIKNTEASRFSFGNLLQDSDKSHRPPESPTCDQEASTSP